MDFGVFAAVAVPIVTGLVAIVLVIGALSLLMTMIAKPKGADLEFLQSGAPGEQLIDYRVCNAMLTDAEPNAFFNLVMGGMGAKEGTELAFDFIRGMTGGLWVGGRVFLTTHRVVFMPNAMNRALHKQLKVIAVRLADVMRVKERFGVGTRIIDIETTVGALTVRCPKSREFAAKVDNRRKQAVAG